MNMILLIVVIIILALLVFWSVGGIGSKKDKDIKRAIDAEIVRKRKEYDKLQ